MDRLERKSVKQFIVKGQYDFLDFGSGGGGSIAWAQRKLGGTKGLGIDISPEKLAIARAAGFDAIDIDILALPASKIVRFTIMRHFLEHLHDPALAYRILRRACQVSREFVCVVQPYFDADGLLAQNGLKLYWSHWTGHPNHMTTLDFHRCLSKLRDRGLARHYSIHGRGPIVSSEDECVLPISSPPNQHTYNPRLHAKKTPLRFEFPVFKEIVAIIGIENPPDPRIVRAIKAASAFPGV